MRHVLFTIITASAGILSGMGHPSEFEEVLCQGENVSINEVSLLQHATSVNKGRFSSIDGYMPTPEYYWASRGRNAMTNSYVEYTSPSNFSSGPSWVWNNTDLGQVRFSPLIDADSNIYVNTLHSLIKLSPDGNTIWVLNAPEGQALEIAPALYRGQVFALYTSNRIPTLFAIDMETGNVDWEQSFDDLSVSNEASSLSAYDGVIFFGAQNTYLDDGVGVVVAADASDGTKMWEYDAGDIMWNFAPSSPGDGTLIFSSSCGVVHCISFQGQQIWKSGESRPREMCSPGGGALGPNGIFYTECSLTDGFDEPAWIVAHNVSDNGARLWEKQLDLPGHQYPAVGRLGSDGPLAVVVGVGHNPMPPLPSEVLEMNFISAHGPMRNKVYALDAYTGEPIWQVELPPWNHIYGAGELDPHGTDEGTMCWPDPQGIPVISGDGTVYASSSQGGQLQAFRDTNGDGEIVDSEIFSFETGQCFLNSPSLAPGMLVSAPCWGPMYVFKQ